MNKKSFFTLFMAPLIIGCTPTNDPIDVVEKNEYDEIINGLPDDKTDEEVETDEEEDIEYNYVPINELELIGMREDDF